MNANQASEIVDAGGAEFVNKKKMVTNVILHNQTFIGDCHFWPKLKAIKD
jgi:hypothetical protein